MLLTHEDLSQAWEDVLRNDLEDGIPAPGVTRFADNTEANLDTLHATLNDGTYRPRDLTEILIPKHDGQRTLHIPAVRDRIVERALLDKITPYVDPWLGPASYAYRPGLGVADAIQAVARLRDEGFSHVLRTDVDDCFPSVRPQLALRMLGVLVPQPALDLATLPPSPTAEARCATAPTTFAACRRAAPYRHAGQPRPHLPGLRAAQRWLRHGPVADDIVVATHGRAEAQEACACRDHPGRNRVKLGPDKTEIMSSPRKGSPSRRGLRPPYPPTLAALRVTEPERRVAVRGALRRTGADGPRPAPVESPDAPRSSTCPVGTCPASCLRLSGSDRRNPDVGDDQRHRRRVRLPHRQLPGPATTGRATTPVDASRQLAVIDDPARRLPIARAIVQAKVTKQIVVIKSFSRRRTRRPRPRRHPEHGRPHRLIPDCSTVQELLGIEGAVAGSTSRSSAICSPTTSDSRRALAAASRPTQRGPVLPVHGAPRDAKRR